MTTRLKIKEGIPKILKRKKLLEHLVFKQLSQSKKFAELAGSQEFLDAQDKDILQLLRGVYSTQDKVRLIVIKDGRQTIITR
jgi:hypothetical protein